MSLLKYILLMYLVRKYLMPIPEFMFIEFLGINDFELENET